MNQKYSNTICITLGDTTYTVPIMKGYESLVNHLSVELTQHYTHLLREYGDIVPEKHVLLILLSLVLLDENNRLNIQLRDVKQQRIHEQNHYQQQLRDFLHHIKRINDVLENDVNDVSDDVNNV